MKPFIVTLFLFFSLSSYCQNLGLGIRLGDPSGITVKKYLSKNAIELNVGRSHLLYGKGWYDNRFNYWYEENRFGYKDFNYLGYKASVPIGIQVHYLFQKSLNSLGGENTAGLTLYYGPGVQFRTQSYHFDYRYKIEGNPDWYYVTGNRITDLDLGADGVIGLEYTFKELPVSVFADATLFMEVADNPFLFWFQGGAGARYNF